MGGVPVLILAAAIGVTYGWQPDGNRGVEYIIQVPEDQLVRLKESGEMSSRIDPEVQGHVSRVVIRVGNGPLPRNTPSAIARSSHHQAVPSTFAGSSADQDLVPIPEMSDRSILHPIGPVGSMVSNQRGPISETASMMKPNANDSPSGSGMALPPSLREAADAARDNIYRGVESAADSMKSTFELPANGPTDGPSTALRSNARVLPPGNEPPSFTGGSFTGGSFTGGSFTNGPTTDPADPSGTARNTPWYGLDKNTSTSSNNATVRSSQASSESRNGEAMGLGTTPNFGRPPFAVDTQQTQSDRNANDAATRSYAQQQQEQLRQQELRKQQEELRQQEIARQQKERERQQAYQQQLAQQQQYQQQQNGRSDQGSGTNSPATYGQSFTPQPSQSSSFNFTGTPSIQTPPSFASNSPTSAAVDPNLSARDAALLPPGGYSFNHSGQAIDRQGRVLDQYGRLAITQPPPQNRPDSVRPDYARPEYSPSDYSPSDKMPNTTSRDYQLAGRSEARSASDRIESSDRSELAKTASPDRVSPEPRRVVAQPLFNGMLLISIIGNIYLAFWLKNLRYQFRDLVAARRTSQTSTSSIA